MERKELMINVFLDDLREAPPGYKRVRTADQAIQLLKTHRVNILSLDYDLGTFPITGNNVIQFMVRTHIYPKKIVIHSANPFGRSRMLKDLHINKPASVPVTISPLPWI